MAGNGPIGGLRRAFADQDLRTYEAFPAPARASPRNAQRPARSQAGDELALERSAALDVQRLVDRLVRDPHRVIIGEVHRQPVCDLLGAPGLGPAPILTPSVTPAAEAHRRSGHQLAVGAGDRPGQPLLDV